MNEIVVLARAHDEILGLIFRLDEWREGLGSECDEEIEEALRFLKQFPEGAPVSEFPPLRRMLVQRFSLDIFYMVHGSRVVIHAVLNLQQDPEYIRRRLQE